jgi:hypothetical protein
LAETARFPEGAAQHYDVMFAAVAARIAAYLKATLGVSTRAGGEAAQRLLGQILFPILPRALFGLESLATELDDETRAAKVDLKPVKKAVAELLASLPER